MRIALLGTENSHALAFAKCIQTDPDFSDLELVGIYGYDPEANQKILELCITDRAADRPDAFLGEVDAVICTARHGDHHYDYTLPYIEAGIPAFIDKPFTVDLAKGKALIEAAKKSGALLCGGSSLKFLKDLVPLAERVRTENVTAGCVSAPINMVNPYAGFYFYAQHLVEMMFAIFGSDVKAVTAVCPDQTQNRVSMIFDYGTFDVTGLYTGSYQYAGNVLTDKGSAGFATFDIGSEQIYKEELLEFARMVRRKELPHPLEDLLKPLTLMHAIEESYQTGKKVEIVW